MEHNSVQKLHLSAIGLLQIFGLFFAGSQVVSIMVMSHTYCNLGEL